jgi:hypothetical protein
MPERIGVLDERAERAGSTWMTRQRWQAPMSRMEEGRADRLAAG